MMNKKLSFVSIALMLFTFSSAQNYGWISSTEGNVWQESKIKLQSSAKETPVLEIYGNEEGTVFTAWGTCFNELGYDALNILTRDEQDVIMRNIWSPSGDLRFTVGRIPMNANDYARDWYSCDEVAGDFQLKYFNIDRDKKVLIPYVRYAQKFNSDLTCWISPWGAPSWMKVNNHYAVRSSEYNDLSPKSDVALYEDSSKKDEGVFPDRLAVNDFFIQDPRYLQTYADYFCKFISAYQEQGIPITKVMFQNEPYSYTPYPGCAWTVEGTIRFNMEYLAPTLKKNHPNIELYMGTFNTNRFEEVDGILSDNRMSHYIKGVGFQWEGGQILPRIRAKYPQYKYMQTESECGWGSFNWQAAEHTFGLINHYLANGCDEYIFWNVILADEGVSTWGWKQNALIRVDSKTRTYTYTPEYYAVKHYTNFISPDSRVIAFNGRDTKLPILVCKTPKNKYIVIAGNFTDEVKDITVKLGEQYLNVQLPSHTLHTFTEK